MTYITQAAETAIAEMKMYDATQTVTINTADIIHAVLGFSTGQVDKWTFDSGGSNTAITAFADAGGGDVTVTSAGHTLAADDIVVITNTTNYNGAYVVQGISGNDFDITHSWDGDDAAGQATQPSTLKAGSSAAGDYKVNFAIAGMSAAGVNKVFEWVVYKNVTAQTQIASERNHSGTDMGSMSGVGFIPTIAEDDIIWLSCANTTGADTTNYTLEHVNVNLERL